MNGKQKRLLKAIFASPTSPTLVWSDIESLLVSLGCEVEEAKGSAIKVFYKDLLLAVHRPHPKKEAKRYQVREVRDFLKDMGITP